MSGDEIVATATSVLLALICWVAWYAAPLRITRMGMPTPARFTLFAAPVLAFGLLLVVLREAASFDVRDDPRYLFMYLAMGAAWVGLAVGLLPSVGISVRDDAVERGNRAAGLAAAGAVLGSTLCFAGGNIGDGPGWWVVLFAAALATGALFALLFVLEVATGVSERVTVERDEAAGFRLAGFLIGAGLILGHGVAGDWVSAGATVRDFLVTVWPVIPLLVLVGFIEMRTAPTPERPHPPVGAHGVVPALLYVAAGVFHVSALGVPR